MASDPAPTLCTLNELVETQAKERPGAPAILAPGCAPLSYGCLSGRIREGVSALHAAGLGRGDRVAIVLPNGPEAAVAFLAVAATATAAPLNPAYREPEFDYYLSDLGARALLVQAGEQTPAVDVARAHGIPVLELVPGPEAGAFTLPGGPGSRPPPAGLAGPEDVALVLHTSGTTARPKRVPLTHANLCASAAHICSALALSARDRCLNVMPLFHIHGLAASLLASLAAGASAVCTPGFYAPEFFAWLAAFDPTWYTAVPTMHQAILARAVGQRETIAAHSLRFIRSCSAALPPQVMAGLEEAFSAPVVEAYGMTEAAHQMASNPLPPGKRKPGSVGVAAGPALAVMDEAGSLLPAGTPGEVVVRGPNVTCGYEDNAAANRSAFTDGWFRTGDQGYLDDEGYLFITGRIKEIINRGGEKVSPREVEEVLLDHPSVAQVAVFAAPHATLGEEVAAAVVLHEGTTTGEREVCEFAGQRLSAYKVPARVLIVPEIPKGPTGKVQRIGLARRLGLATGNAPEERAPYVAPRNAVEELVGGIWAEVLHLERVGVHDGFVQAGGDSILAMLIISRLRDAIGVELSLPRFFEVPTVAGQAAAVVDSLLQESEERAE